jgi:hypothetical protein
MKMKDYALDLEDETGICSACSGSGEGMYEGTRCLSCGGRGEVGGPSREDYEADRADYLNDLAKDERLLGDA